MVHNCRLVPLIQEVLPADPKRPRYMRFIVQNLSTQRVCVAEFDTEESAQDWRKELRGMTCVSTVEFVK